MNILKNLSKSTLTAMLTITLLVFGSLWIYEKYYIGLEEEKRKELYHKLIEENQSLIYEIQNLKAQNKILIRIIELKQKLE